ncbi:MAG: transposase, partial [Candidatus Thorarchaeota archaeon]
LFAPRHDLPSMPPAIMGIDLGVRKAVCSVLLTKTGAKHVSYWTQKDKVKQMQHYDSMVASLQKKRDSFINNGKDASAVNKKLREISSKRENISTDHDRKLVNMLVSHILELCQEYELYIAIGRVKGIRSAARRGNWKGKQFRGMIHRWSFYRITEALKHKLSYSGLDEKRVFTVSESWTSIKCHKCGHKGVRPKQSYFLCHTCGYRDNADKNGAINIGRRLIMLIPSLQDEKNGLGTWLHPKEKATLKTRRRSSSKGKSILPKMTPVSSEGKSVVDCNDQETLEGLVSSTDPAMATTVETPSAAERSGALGTSKQGTEAQLQERSDAPMTLNKGHVTVDGASHLLIGDNSHDKGGTQKSEVKEASSVCNVSTTSEGIRSGSHTIGFPRNIMEDIVEQVGSRNKVSYLLRQVGSSAPKKLPASIAGSSVADCTDQTSLEEFVSSTDQAMPKTMEEPSVITDSGDHDSIVQRTEATSVGGRPAPSADKTRAHPTGEVLLVAGDSGHEEG